MLRLIRSDSNILYTSSLKLSALPVKRAPITAFAIWANICGAIIFYRNFQRDEKFSLAFFTSIKVYHSILETIYG